MYSYFSDESLITASEIDAINNKIKKGNDLNNLNKTEVSLIRQKIVERLRTKNYQFLKNGFFIDSFNHGAKKILRVKLTLMPNFRDIKFIELKEVYEVLIPEIKIDAIEFTENRGYRFFILWTVVN